MTKKKNGFVWGLLIGFVLAVIALLVYQEYFQKSKFEREAQKFEKKATKELKKAQKLFE